MMPATNQNQSNLLVRMLVFCGILSSVLYIAMNLAVPLQYEGYDPISQTISELSAINSPTQSIWIPFGLIYTLLFTAFGSGLYLASSTRRIRYVAALLIVYGMLGIGWAFAPMHRREIIAAGGADRSDTMHLVLSGITVLLMFIDLIIAANCFGKRFRQYSFITIVLMGLFGAWTFIEAKNIDKGLSTPWLGLVERILVLLFIVWVIVLSLVQLRQMRFSQ